MKYTAMNIRKFAAHETIVFVMTIICIICSSIIINFSFGFYQQLQQEKEDALSGVDEFIVDFQDETKTIVTKGRLLQVLFGLEDDILKDCIINFEIRFAQDRSDNPAVDNSMLVESVHFCIVDGKLALAPIEEEMKGYSMLVEGDYFSAEQFENGELVCLNAIYQAENFSDPEEIKWAQYYNTPHDGKYIVNGKEYTSIGQYDSFMIVPMVPITTLDDNCYVQRVVFSYPHAIMRYQYDAISKGIKDEFDDHAIIPDIENRELDSQKFYKQMMLFTIIVAVASGVVMALLYEYIMMKRKEKLMIFRLCGLSRRKAARIYFTECALIIMCTYAASVIAYHNAFLPFLSKSFVYMSSYYNLQSYLVLSGIYIISSMLFMYILIITRVRNEISEGIRGI